MKELIFQVEFLSDIILPATSNTQGNIKQLDFIPGSNFLGIVAQNYKDFEDSFQVFHSGDVKFGDASILNNDSQTYKMPLSFFYEKTDTKEEKTIYNHHKIDDFKDLEQLKQLRDGYITKDNKTIFIDYNYSQKSAYDKKNRRSLDSSMFGYSAIKSGTKWQFKISHNNLSSKDEALLQSSILGTKRLGKSKSAQYGLIKITQKSSNEDIQNLSSNEIILYANSRLALIDECGNPTYDLKYLFDDLKEENIDYSNTQIKTSTFTPYNGIRQTKDYERVCINKGSVIVIKNIQIDTIPRFIGAYQSEGFGELLINPSFLLQNNFQLKSLCIIDHNDLKLPIKSNLAKFLQNRNDDKKSKLDILDEVDSFIIQHKKLYQNLRPSQWGQIRSICTNENFKDEIRDYISSGTKKWEEKQISILLDEKYTLEFIKLLSIQMPKAQIKEGK